MMKQKSQRNGAIDFWRFAFSILIVICHSPTLPSFAHDNIIWFKGGSIGVEFFFITSGFLMAKHSYTEGVPTGKATWDFIKSKYLAIFPTYLFAYIVSLIVKSALGDNFLKLFGSSIYELLFLHNAGLYQLFNARNFVVVQASWYVSAMLLSMFILYPILYSRRDMFLHVIAPLLTVFLLGYFATNLHQLHATDKFRGVLRATVEICLGCVAYQVCESLKKRKFTKAVSVFLTIVEFMCYISVFVTAFFFARGMQDFIIILVLALGIILSFSGKTYSGMIFRASFCGFLGKWSVAIYLNHMIIITLFIDMNMPLSFKTEVFLVFALVFALSLVCVFTTDIVKTLLKKRKESKQVAADNT